MLSLFIFIYTIFFSFFFSSILFSDSPSLCRPTLLAGQPHSPTTLSPSFLSLFLCCLSHCLSLDQSPSSVSPPSTSTIIVVLLHHRPPPPPLSSSIADGYRSQI
ncbi:hypothetical protein L195_g054430 [Trifolium pratense]|uniref:Uncharacterized protein n=1 Tax=Trifolium pratense TaxID=57577 RepID=A0A2K3KFZ9_TRIPR|nr:hypothetical protein L195_g054430 [Trifolium pratense]